MTGLGQKVHFRSYLVLIKFLQTYDKTFNTTLSSIHSLFCKRTILFSSENPSARNVGGTLDKMRTPFSIDQKISMLVESIQRHENLARRLERAGRLDKADAQSREVEKLEKRLEGSEKEQKEQEQKRKDKMTVMDRMKRMKQNGMAMESSQA